MKKVNVIEFDGSSYLLPAGITDAKIADLAAALLMLRRVDYLCDKEYRQSFHYVDADSARVRLGIRALYDSEQDAKAARDAHNATLPEAQSA